MIYINHEKFQPKSFAKKNFGQIIRTNFQFQKMNFIDENKRGLSKLNIKSVLGKEQQQTGSLTLPIKTLKQVNIRYSTYTGF